METAKILEGQLDSVHKLRFDQPLRRKSPGKDGSRDPSQEKLISTGIFNGFGKIATEAETYLGSSRQGSQSPLRVKHGSRHGS